MLPFLGRDSRPRLRLFCSPGGELEDIAGAAQRSRACTAVSALRCPRELRAVSEHPLPPPPLARPLRGGSWPGKVRRSRWAGRPTRPAALMLPAGRRCGRGATSGEELGAPSASNAVWSFWGPLMSQPWRARAGQRALMKARHPLRVRPLSSLLRRVSPVPLSLTRLRGCGLSCRRR